MRCSCHGQGKTWNLTIDTKPVVQRTQCVPNRRKTKYTRSIKQLAMKTL
ncbi:hypothetical protein PAMC26577_34880 [Caballeronia sordidicola]|uniref:Uncharacterized protein n=1 Tax=Caballeronia sordidicola TaxID=196367 RepID=A0A242M9P8_CABSO|nr:hypothetical protein PAMC26577_34880 [Caballeronia sordidicola]